MLDFFSRNKKLALFFVGIVLILQLILVMQQKKEPIDSSFIGKHSDLNVISDKSINLKYSKKPNLISDSFKYFTDEVYIVNDLEENQDEYSIQLDRTSNAFTKNEDVSLESSQNFRVPVGKTNDYEDSSQVMTKFGDMYNQKDSSTKENNALVAEDYISEDRVTEDEIYSSSSTESILRSDNSDKVTTDTVTMEVLLQDKLIEVYDIVKSKLNVFFIESTCGTTISTKSLNGSDKFLLNARQCCAVESVAKANPGRTVYILYTCPLEAISFTHVPAFIHKILSLPNVFLIPTDVRQIFRNSPVEELIIRNELENSMYPVVHASDIMRLLVLWKFGGMYLDLDVITLRNMNELGTNFAGLQSNSTINNAILNFEPDGDGHQLVSEALEDVNECFNGKDWQANGPDLITRTILKHCNVTILNVTSCSKYKVYEMSVLYPVPWNKYSSMFNTTLGSVFVDKIKTSGFTLHLWNRDTQALTVKVGSKQPLGLLAAEFCPAVYNNCGSIF